MAKNEKQTLDWDAFRNLGNPSSSEEISESTNTTDIGNTINLKGKSIRVHIEKKGRGNGSAVSIIRGLDIMSAPMKELAKELKTLCGVGGTVKNKEIIIQGDKRDVIIDHLKKYGVKDIKKSGG